MRRLSSHCWRTPARVIALRGLVLRMWCAKAMKDPNEYRNTCTDKEMCGIRANAGKLLKSMKCGARMTSTGQW